MSHLFNTFQTTHINVFLDESGKKNDRPNLLGALSIPQKIYDSDDFRYLNFFLKAKSVKFHWKNYNGNEYAKENILNLIEALFIRQNFLKFNVINYHYGYLKGQNSFCSDEDIDETIYNKIPERLIYGLIRGYGSEMRVSSNIFIDAASEYKKLNLEERLVKTLNSHSLYRGERFHTAKCNMYPKNHEIGLEITDVLLGIIRTIIENLHIQPDTSKIKKEKILLVSELLNNDNFKNFLSSIKYYEWRGDKNLNEINFSDYISAFIVEQTI